MWGKCGENVGKIGYKNGLQVSVGHLRVPGAGIEPARIAPLVFETSASTDSAIRANRRLDLLVEECKGIGIFGICKIFVAMVGTNMYIFLWIFQMTWKEVVL